MPIQSDHFYDMAWDHAYEYEDALEEQSSRNAFARGAEWCAAWTLAFAAMGKWCALNAPRVVEREYWTRERDGERLYNCFCPGCGAYLKGLDAGVDEGTDAEYCGSCRE